MKDSMKQPVVRRCPDNHFRRVVFGFGPFIADYPEQVVLAGIVQGWCCRYILSRHNEPILTLSRCAACSDDLDGNLKANRRTCEHTEMLRQTFDPGILWDEYGVDEGVVVLFFFTLYFKLLTRQQ